MIINNRIIRIFSLVVIALFFSLQAKADTDNTLTVADVSCYGGDQVVLSVNMNNSASITGFQFDLYLPEGLQLAKDPTGNVMIALSTTRTSISRHSLSCKVQADGAMRVACTSLSNALFFGNSGEVATITLDIPANLASRDYTIEYKKIELTTPALVQYKTSLLTSIVTVAEASLGKEECATPVISFTDGRIACTSMTPGSVCHYSLSSIACADADGLVQFVLTVTAYAEAEGYNRSAAAVRTFTIQFGDVNLDGNIDIGDVTTLVNKILQKDVSK